MPDTKSGRERKGVNKRAQLRERLYGKELERLEAEEEEEELPGFGPEDATDD
ncbi:MAG: hypothetical protein ABEJ61_02880 [Haloferacaceae archaeon]